MSPDLARPTPAPSLGWVRALVERHGQELARLVLQRGLPAQEGFFGVETCICAFLTLPQARQIATQPDDTRRMMTLLLGAVVQSVQVRHERRDFPAQSGDFDPALIRLLLLEQHARVCDALGLNDHQREVLLSTCPEVLRRQLEALTSAPQEAPRSTRWNEENFEQQLARSRTPVLVHFEADWCKPCHLLSPLLEELSSQRNKQLLITSVDVEKNPALPLRYRVRALPTLLMFRERVPLGSLVGATSRDRLVAWVDSLLASS